MSWRRFKVLLMGLPPESEYKTALRNTVDLSALPDLESSDYGPWSQTDMLIARVGDLIAYTLWVNADPATRPPTPPAPYPRPGVEQPRSISDEAIAYLEYLREHHGEAPPDDWTPATA